MNREYDVMVAFVFRALPDRMQERKIILEALLAMLPADYRNRNHVEQALEFLRAHEAKQLTFLRAFDAANPDQSDGDSIRGFPIP